MSFLFGDDKSKLKYTGNMAEDVANLKFALDDIQFQTQSAAGGFNGNYDHVDFTFNPLTRGFIFANSANGAANGIMSVYVDSEGWVNVFPLIGMSNQQVTHAITGQLRIENRSNSVCMYAFMAISGDLH